MTRYIVKRLLQIIPVLLGVTLLVFFLLSLTPGDPARLALGSDATEEQLELFREKNGLNDPLIIQYCHYMINAAEGDLGISYSTRQSVSEMISSRVGNTLTLAIGAMIIAVLISLPLGVMMAVKQNSLFDNFMRVFTLLFNSMPAFWLGMMMILLFSVKLGWLPANGFDSIKAMIMPMVCLALGIITLLSRTGRSSMLEVIHQDYIRTAKAKGLRYGYIIRHHAVKNSLLPLLAIYGHMVGASFGGSVVIESVFGINGIGLMMTEALRQKDTNTIMGCIIISAIVIAMVNLLTDLAYGFIDPRIKSIYGKSKKRNKKGISFAIAKRKKKKPKVAEKSEVAVTAEVRPALFEREDNKEESSSTATYKSKMKSYKKRSLWADVWMRLRKNTTAIIGFILLIIIVIACLSAPLFYSFEEDIIAIDVVNRLQGPSTAHLFGTDELGRDVLARILWGGRTSIICGVLSLAVAFTLGAILGTIAGYYGGLTDTLIMRAIDVVMAIPAILLMITLATIMKPNTMNLVLAIGLSLVPGQARMVRGQVLQVVDREFVEAAKIEGANGFKIIVSHVLPNALSPIITTVLMDIGYTITMISMLSFIGLGIQPPNPEWGSMLASGRTYIRDAWNITTFPGLALMGTVVALTLMGDGVRDALDPRIPRMKKR